MPPMTALNRAQRLSFVACIRFAAASVAINVLFFARLIPDLLGYPAFFAAVPSAILGVPTSFRSCASLRQRRTVSWLTIMSSYAILTANETARSADGLENPA